MEQRWWNSGTSDGGRVEHTVEQSNRGGKQLNIDGGTLEHLMVEQCNRGGETVEHRWWNIRTPDGGTVEHLMVER